MTGYLSAPGAGGSPQERCLKNTREIRQNANRILFRFPNTKTLLVFLFGMIFIEIIKYNNSVTDMQSIYRYTPLVKQAMSLRKLINVLCLTVLYRIPPGMPIGSFNTI